jgi:hypothetical protein
VHRHPPCGAGLGGRRGSARATGRPGRPAAGRRPGPGRSAARRRGHRTQAPRRCAAVRRPARHPGRRHPRLPRHGPDGLSGPDRPPHSAAGRDRRRRGGRERRPSRAPVGAALPARRGHPLALARPDPPPAAPKPRPRPRPSRRSGAPPRRPAGVLAVYRAAGPGRTGADHHPAHRHRAGRRHARPRAGRRLRCCYPVPGGRPVRQPGHRDGRPAPVHRTVRRRGPPRGQQGVPGSPGRCTCSPLPSAPRSSRSSAAPTPPGRA